MVSRTFGRSAFPSAGEHLDDAPVSRVMKEVVGVKLLLPQEGIIQQRTAEEVQEQIVQDGKAIPQERLSVRMVEEMGDTLPHRIAEEIVGVVQTCTVEKTDNVECFMDGER